MSNEDQPEPTDAEQAAYERGLGDLTSGQRMERSLADFRRALKVTFEENEAKPLPDTALRALLLDADRLADEVIADRLEVR